MNELELFAAAIATDDPGERAALLDRECAGQPDVRFRIDQLLEAHFRSQPLLDRPAPELTGVYAVHERPGVVIAGRYKLLEAIGEGGMGTVWVAEQTQPVRRKVALKLIKAGMDSKSVIARFEAERQALAVMDHPNVAKVLDGGLTETGRPFFVMDYVKGVPITEFCDATRLSVPERLQLFAQVCQAVQHAHQKGIIHRDLKPSNILVAPYDDKPVPKIIDFGLAKAMHQSLTEKTLHTAHESVLGTPLYMSPEQAQLNNLDVDTRSDIYSLGVLLYELLTGTTPLEKQRFKEAAWDEIRRIIREEEPPKPSTRLSSATTLPSLAAGRHTEPIQLTKLVRGELDWIVMKALEKDRARRYETANGFALDIQRYLAGEPVLAAPPSTRYRLQKLAGKHRAALTTATAILLLLTVGIAVSAWQAFRAIRAERVALNAQQAEAERAEGERKAKQDAQTSAAAEKQAREQAQKRLAQIEKGNEIITAIFTDLDLNQVKEGTEPLEAILAQRLVEAAVQLEGEAVGDPLAVAGLQSQLGQSLLNLGHAHDAIPLFVKARETRTAKLGTEHIDTLTAMYNVAHGYLDAGKLDLALPLSEESVKLSKAILGADHPLTLASMGNLAAAYREAGKLDLALPLYEQTLKLQRANLGVDDPNTLKSMNNLALGYWTVGKLDLALPLLEETLKVNTARLGSDHHQTIASMNALAAGYSEAGKRDLALPLFEKSLKLAKGKLGSDHPATLATMNNLANCYRDVGKLDLALPVLEELVKLAKGKMGADHPHTLICMTSLAVGYSAAGKRDLALPLYQEAAKGIELRHYQHPNAGRIINNLIECHELFKQFDQAEAWRRKWLAEVKVRSDADPLPYVGELAGLGRNLLQQKKWTDAEPVLRECLALRQQKQPDAWTTFNAQSMLGGALLGQKKFAEAEPLLVTGYEGIKLREKTIPPQVAARIPEALDRLIELYTATNQPADVKKWQVEQAKYAETNAVEKE